VRVAGGDQPTTLIGTEGAQNREVGDGHRGTGPVMTTIEVLCSRSSQRSSSVDVAK
jgi:hypothetical protein